MNNFNISKTFKGISNILQNFTFIEATVFETAGGSARQKKGVDTKRLGKGRVHAWPSVDSSSDYGYGT